MAMAADPTGGGLDAGPSDHDLITSVLRPMAAGRQLAFHGGGGFIHMADVYSAAPERLAERYAPAPAPRVGGGGDGDGNRIRYFICPARCRYRAAAAGAIGQGGWTSETGVAMPVRAPDGRRVGQSRALSYGAMTVAPWTVVTRHGWCMVELALDDHGGGGFVLCKLFRSTRGEGSSMAAAASTAVPAAFLSSCKRKAVVGDHPEAPPTARQQLMQRQQRSF